MLGIWSAEPLDRLCPLLHDNLDLISHNPGGKYNGQNTHPQRQELRILLDGCHISALFIKGTVRRDRVRAGLWFWGFQ